MTHRNPISRRTLMQGAAASAALGLAPALAQTAAGWPDHPIRMVIPYPAGGSTDFHARLIGQWLSERLGQQFIIDNRPGAGTNIATDATRSRFGDHYPQRWPLHSAFA